MKQLKMLLLTSMLILLTACGGGGGTDGLLLPTQADGTSPQPINKTTVSGTAVDDLIVNGKVKVLKSDTALLAEGRTSTTKGTYTLGIENYTGAVVVNVTCDADSRILVGTTEEVCPAGLELNSVANVYGNEVTINISPLTDIIYQRAVILGGGQITEDSVTTASNEISIMFGVDPIQNDPTTGTYAATIDAFHAVADADPERDLFDVIDDFVVDMNDGVVDNSEALIDALEAENITNPLTESGDTGYVIPNNPASNDDVAEVKAMVQSLRTQITTLEDYAESEAEDIGIALDSVAIDVNTVTNYIVEITDLVDQAREGGDTTLTGSIDGVFRDPDNGFPAQTSIVVTQSPTNPDQWTYITGDDGHSYTGTITIPEITEGIEYTFTSINATFNGTLPYTEYIYNQTPNIQTQNVRLNIALKKTTEGADVTLTDFTIENNANKISIDSLTGSVSYSEPADPTADPILNYVKLDAVTLSATAGDYIALGTLNVLEYVVNTTLEDNSGVIPKKIIFTGSVKNTVTGGELSGTVNIDFLNAVTVDLSTDDDLIDEIALKVDLAAKMIMPQRPDTLVNLAYETKVDDDAHRHSITGSYNYDTTLVTVAGSVDKNGDNGELTFTNGSGIVATFIMAYDMFINGDAATSTGSLITKDGRVVATIEERGDDIIIIKYLDGSFESIF